MKNKVFDFFKDKEKIIKELEIITNKLTIRNLAINHYAITNTFLHQHMFDTDTLFDIIQSAKFGQIHPSLLDSNELLTQFKDTKIWIHNGTDLPIELKGNSYELLKLSELAVNYSDDKIVFIISIALVYQHILTLYKLLPKPVYKQNHCIYIKPSFSFLTI